MTSDSVRDTKKFLEESELSLSETRCVNRCLHESYQRKLACSLFQPPFQTKHQEYERCKRSDVITRETCLSACECLFRFELARAINFD